MTAHRISWELHFGSIPPGMYVLHRCDVNYPVGDISYRSCIRPDHLFLGTHKDNMVDMRHKKRGTRGRHLHSKLTAEQVLTIRTSQESRATLAKEYGVVTRTIGDILQWNTWRHVT